jgi:hypothetical protein
LAAKTDSLVVSHNLCVDLHKVNVKTVTAMLPNAAILSWLVPTLL